MLPLLAETDCHGLIWYWIAGAAQTNEAPDAGEEAAEQAIKMEADMRVDGTSRWGQGS